MIITYRRDGQIEVEKDGVKSTIKTPPPVFLNLNGAFIEVTITHPRSVQENLKKQGKDTPAVSVSALIDTGASCTVITPRVAEQLALKQTGFKRIFTAHPEEQLRPVYYGFIIFSWGHGNEIPIVSCDLKEFDCLIGRDILSQWYLTYNGQHGSFVICD